MTNPSRTLPSSLFCLLAAAAAITACQRPPATALLDGGNPYLAYPEKGGLGCQRPNDRLFAVTLAPESGPVCLSSSLRGAHVASLVELQRCEQGKPCVPCADGQCLPGDCFPAAATVPLEDDDCWLPLEASPFDPQSHFVVLRPAAAGTPPAASGTQLLPQIVIISPSAEVAIVPDPLHASFALGRFGPRLAGAAPPPGGDCDSGNCGAFPVFQPAADTAGFLVRSPANVTRWQGSIF